MPSFDISFSGDSFTDEGIAFRPLRLTIGNFSEEMHADFGIWSTADYERQWLFELKQLTSARNRGALITSINNPQCAFRVCTWPMWKQNDVIVFQNRLLFMFAPNFDFRPEQVHEEVGEHSSISEDGAPISEWTIPIAPINSYITQRLSA